MNRLVTNDKSQVQVIARAATILRALEDENSGLSLGQIAQRVNLARSTVQRIVAALETEKLVIAATPNGRVRLGPTILRLASSVRSDFTALARPFLERLSEELHETVDLSTVKKDHLVFIDQVIGPHRLRTVSAVGETFPLYCTANGKAYLARLTDPAVEALIGRAYEPRTPKTLTRIDALLTELKAARRNGAAFDREEHTLGICAVGVAMQDPLGNAVAKKIRGVMFEENLKNSMGLEFYNLSHRFGYQSPNWPYFEDVKIERIHYMAKSGVLSQRITTSMHNTTHIDAPAHVVQGTPFIDEVPLPHFFGSGIVVSIPKDKWEPITGDDLEKACGKIIRPRDVVIVNTGWHHKYEDSEDYFCRSPGFVPSAGEWFVKKKVKVVGHDTQANDHPLATAIGPQRNGPLHPHLAEEYREWSGGRDWKDDFPEWEPVHRILFKNGIMGIENVGGDLDKVTGKRVTFAYFPWNWDRGDGCIVRLVAILDPKQKFRIEKGSKF